MRMVVNGAEIHPELVWLSSTVYDMCRSKSDVNFNELVEIEVDFLGISAWVKQVESQKLAECLTDEERESYFETLDLKVFSVELFKSWKEKNT